MKKTTLALIAALTFIPALSHAHSVWINLFESHAHQPPHAMVSLGWGHALPMDDILTSPMAGLPLNDLNCWIPISRKPICSNRNSSSAPPS